jgi:hypothetical protein
MKGSASRPHPTASLCGECNEPGFSPGPFHDLLYYSCVSSFTSMVQGSLPLIVHRIHLIESRCFACSGQQFHNILSTIPPRCCFMKQCPVAARALIDIETLLFGEEKSVAETNSIFSSRKLKETVYGDGERSSR